MPRKTFHKIMGVNPQWSKPFSKSEYSIFRQKLLDLSMGGLDTDDCDSVGLLSFQGAGINVSNLVKLCANIDQDQWNDEISRWLKALAGSNNAKPAEVEPDLQSLKLQLYPDGYFGTEDPTERFLVNETIPGVISTVVIDEPDRLIVPTKEQLGSWAKNPVRTFETLMLSLQNAKPYPVEFINSGVNQDEELIASITSDDITTATHALVLSKMYPELIGAEGALVGIPYRHLILVKRLDKEPSREILFALQSLVDRITKDRPDYISNQIYFYKHGTFKLFT